MSEQGDGKGAAGKVCVQCKQDCSSKPRQKDAQGRYHCKECVDKRAAKQAAAAAPVAVLDEPEPLAFDLVGAVSAAPAGRPCSECGVFMAEKAVICVGCGFNANTGMQAQTHQGTDKQKAAKRHKGGASACSNCGYSLKGLRSPKCPECGTVNRLETDRRALDREESRNVMRRAYTRPLLMFLIGIGVVCAVVGSGDDPAVSVIAYLMGFGIQLPIGMAVYLACAVLWLGFDAPLHLIVLRLLGIYAVVDAIQVIANLALFPLISSLIACAFYVHLLSEMLEMDLTDAVIVGLLTFLVKYVIAIYVIMTYFSN